MSDDIFARVKAVEITKKTAENIIRKSAFVDDVVFDSDGHPLFSWIDISVTDLCNRACVFCPRVDPDVYPNQNLHMSLQLAEKMAKELSDLNYRGGVVLCGYGEPLLHPRIETIVEIFSKVSRLEIVTNGDRLTVELLRRLFQRGLSFLCVSMYDGPHQQVEFERLFHDAGVSSEKFILRDRWHKEEDSFGLKLTNRGGVLEFGPKGDFSRRPCYYPAYSMTVDWNGDVLLCVQDWQKKVKLGNLSGCSLIEVWKSVRMHKYRSKLVNGKRDDSPCKGCNAEGVMHGFNHVNGWVRADPQEP